MNQLHYLISRVAFFDGYHVRYLSKTRFIVPGSSRFGPQSRFVVAA